jgi:hypothetical protein
LADDLSLEVSEALGVSLSEVYAHHFGGSDEVKGDRVLAEERDQYREQQRFEEDQRIEQARSSLGVTII